MVLVASLLFVPIAVLGVPTAVEARSQSVLKVASSIAPLAGIVARVGGIYVETSILLPEGTEPHVSQLPIEALNAANSADLLVFTGHFPWESDLASQTGKPFISFDDQGAIARYVDFGATLSPMPGAGVSGNTTVQNHEEGNPHGYWLLSKNAKAIADATRAALTIINSTMSEVLDMNLERFMRDVEAFDNLVTAKNAAYHFSDMHAVAVFAEETYVAEAFGIQCDAVLQVEGVSISAGELLRVQEALQNGTIQLIVGSDVARLQTGGEFAYQMAKDYGGTLVWWNTIFFSGLSDYLSLMTYNLGALTSALDLKGSAGSGAPMNLALAVLSGLLAVIVAIETVLLIQRSRAE